MKNNFIPKFILAAIFLSISAVSFADPLNSGICPSVSAIKAVGLTKAELLSKDIYVDYSLNDYGTPDNWAFFVDKIKAKSRQNALKKGTSALRSLSGSPKPSKRNAAWICVYRVEQRYV